VCYPKTLEQAWAGSVNLLALFCAGLDQEEERGKFLGIPAGKAADYFQWRRKKGVDAKKVVLPPGMAAALNDLYYAMCRRMQFEYEAGLKDGTGLLRRLASGDITVHDVGAVRGEEAL
jgi:hypothetical protein